MDSCYVVFLKPVFFPFLFSTLESFLISSFLFSSFCHRLFFFFSRVSFSFPSFYFCFFSSYKLLFILRAGAFLTRFSRVWLTSFNDMTYLFSQGQCSLFGIFLSLLSLAFLFLVCYFSIKFFFLFLISLSFQIYVYGILISLVWLDCVIRSCIFSVSSGDGSALPL